MCMLRVRGRDRMDLGLNGRQPQGRGSRPFLQEPNRANLVSQELW